MKINKIERNAFFKNSSNSKPKKEEQQNPYENNLLLYGTIGLVGLGVAAYYLATPKKLAQNTTVKNYLQNYSPQEQLKIKKRTNKFYKLKINNLVNGINDFYEHAAAYKEKLTKKENIINILGISKEDRKTLTKFLAASVEEPYRHIKFKTKNFDLIQSSLDNMAPNTYVYIENLSEFLKHNGQLPNKLNYFSDTQESIIKLSSDKKLNFENEFEDWNILINPQPIENSKEIENILSKRMYKSGFAIKKALTCNESCNLNLLKAGGIKDIDDTLEFLANTLNSKLFRVSTKTLDKDIESILDYQYSTGKKAIIYFDNEKESQIYEKVKNLESVIVAENIKDADGTILTKTYTNLSTNISNINENMQKINNLYFDDDKILKHELLNWLLIKDINGKYVSPINGFILTGDNKTTQKALQQVSFITELPVITIDFTDFEKGIQNCVKELETANGKKLYDLINTEHVLCDYKDNLDKIILLGRFKNLMETTMAKYDGTGVLRTNTPLDKFEPASIADHRFNVTLKTKE